MLGVHKEMRTVVGPCWNVSPLLFTDRKYYGLISACLD